MKITDKMRLDWLMRYTGTPFRESLGQGRRFQVFNDSADSDFYGKTRRRAIDAAIRAQSKPRRRRGE